MNGYTALIFGINLINDIKNWWSYYTLLKASFSGNLDIVQLWINSGASFNLRNEYGYTALDGGMFYSLIISNNYYNIYLIAYEMGHQNVIDLLIAAGGVYNQYKQWPNFFLIKNTVLK
jgi:ankyrin repeat protein